MRELLANKQNMGIPDPRLTNPTTPLYGDNEGDAFTRPATVTLDDATLERLADMVAKRLTQKKH